MDLRWAPLQSGGPDPDAEGRFREFVRSRLLSSFRNEPPFFDEPKPWALSGTLSLGAHLWTGEAEADEEREFGFAGACSFSFDKALNRLCGEAAERFVLLPPPSGLEVRAWRSFPAGEALDPQMIVAGAKRTPPERRHLDLTWLPARDAASGALVNVPAQLVDVPHLFEAGEPVIRAPITTGAAVGWSLEECVWRGLAEVIERDAFMINWLLGPRGRTLEPDRAGSKKAAEWAALCEAVSECRRYRLRPVFAELLTPEALSVVTCALFDDTGVGPRFSLGASASYAPGPAALKALEEALQLRLWLRSEREAILSYADRRGDQTAPSTIRSRAALCFDHVYSARLETLLAVEGDAPIAAESSLQTLHDVLSVLESNGASVYVVDLTERLPDDLTTVGLRAAKVIVPQLQPLYLTEALADIAWDRIDFYRDRYSKFRGGDLNPLPHPFL